jgi:hypothetical protein
VPASVRQRLLNQAKATQRPYNELLQHYAMERFLYRLCQSPHAEVFVLKGALLLRAWNAPSVRPTMDIDLLGRTSNEPANLTRMMRDVCQHDVEPDGLTFDAASVTSQVIAEEADYEGVRLRFRGNLGTARVNMQIDVGFGDVITPAPLTTEYPTLLDYPPPRLLAYPRETTVAEKFQVMLHRAQLNSRLRDYFDVWLLARSFSFDGAILAEAIRKTCDQRGTTIPVEPIALTTAFSDEASRQTQWAAYRRKSRLDMAPEQLAELVEGVAVFLGPIAGCLGAGQEFGGTWNPSGPWHSK